MRRFLRAAFLANWRMTLYIGLICLPATMIAAVGIYFVCTRIPGMARAEGARVTREYRKSVERLLKNPELGNVTTNAVPRDRRANRIGRVPWGRFADGGRTIVWYQTFRNVPVEPTDGRAWKDNAAKTRRTSRRIKEWHTLAVPTVEKFPYELVFYGWGGFILLVLVGLTFLAVRYFVRFVRERDDFLAATAHDLTTPLVGMRLMIGRSDEEARRLNERMLLIVNNIKDFLRLGGRRREPVRTRFDLAAACREAYELFAADYEDSEGGPVVFDDSRLGGVPLETVADETMTLQILWNLFGNDLKYAAPYGGVTVRFFRTGQQAVVEFADEGQGMTPRQMRRAFDRYYRAKTVMETGKGGFGIGLCTAREFARTMGGDLTVRANAPRGCVFALALPVAI